MDDKLRKQLIHLAFEARMQSYSPYSEYAVGAALLCADQAIYTGCNIENASYSPTNCAERTAFFKAVSEGERSFVAIAIVGGPENTVSGLCTPCGVCRQVMAEFCDKNFEVILGTPEKHNVYSLDEIIPLAFTKSELSHC